ncbi:hypothetical protein LJB77_01405 [Ruminococcaceae bacterium OttesenSCG-928-N02]|nr:hypothetical protein [Ruminococcaceae bacterium OttesenSCG-928-N02]
MDRILKQTGDPKMIEKLLALPRADLNSLLLALFDKQSMRLSPQGILKAYSQNRFSVPGELDPAAFHALEAELLRTAQNTGMQTVLLSPCAPLGSCSVFGCVNQYNVISSLRGVETLSDPSNMLAIIIADKLKNRACDNTTPLHYATSARVVRAQPVEGEGFFAHFGVYCMVSSGKDRGAYMCEKELLEKHLLFYRETLQTKFGAKLSIVLCKRSGYKDGDGFFEQISEAIQAILPGTPLAFANDDLDNRYYQGINFKIMMHTKGGAVEIGDGGFVNWMSQMLGSKKERCLISGIGLDRLVLCGE